MAAESEKKVKIIIADDDFSVRNAVRSALLNSRYEVIGEASDGMNAVELAEKMKPDMALLDIEMPMMDGITASKLLLDKKLCYCTVMLTSFDQMEYVEDSLKGGAEGYLTKPFSTQQLLATLDMCLRQSKERHLAEKEYRNLEKKISGKDIVNTAKLILMEEKQLSENEAYTYLRELSKRKNISMESLAEMMIQKDG